MVAAARPTSGALGSRGGGTASAQRPAPAVLAFLLLVFIACLPLMYPQGPAGSRPVDVVMLVLLCAALPMIGRVPLSLPQGIALGAFLIILGGCLGALDAPEPGEFLLTLVKDAYPVAILALGYSLLRTERLHSRCVTVLAWSAVMAAGVAVLALKLHLGGKVPLVASHGGRAVGTFQNPNMAAGFFLLGLFLMPATEWPRSRLVRLASGALVLWAILLTGSNGAKAAVLGGALAYIGYAWVRGGPAPLRALKLLLYLVAIAALTAAMAWALTSLMTRVLPIAAYRIGHLPVSIFDRLLIVRDDLAIWRANPFGVGAGMSAAARGESMAYKQALGGHNEFITMLVERGFVGAIGFLLIIGSGLLMTWRAHGAPVLTGLTRRAPAAYAATFVALLVLGTTHDIIHFRFLWVLLAAIAVHHRLARAVGEQRPGMSDSRARAADDTFTNTDRMSKVT